MTISIYQVDAFTNQAYAGNPAAVCLLSAFPEDARMQAIAQEMNLSETALVVPLADGSYHLRWFTPMLEIALCGHATLASAHVLFTEGHLPADQTAHFQTLSGALTCTMGDAGWITMNFPSRPVVPVAPPPGLLEGLGVKPLFVGHNAENDYLIEVETVDMVRNLQLNPQQLSRVSARGVMVTSRSENASVDFVSRWFALLSGVDEDPVTGSAHCGLAPYWAEKLGKDTLIGYQASARGGVVRMQLADERVNLSGQAVTVLRGELL